MSERDEAARVRRQAKLCGRDSLNRLDRWRLEVAEREEARAAERRAEERVQQQQKKQSIVEQLRAEMATLRAEMYELHEVVIQATGDALGTHSDKIIDIAEKFVKDNQREFLKGLAELRARLDNMLPETRAARTNKDFKFASESTDVDIIDMPSPLVRKVTVN
jgi:hypothetical protein